MRQLSLLLAVPLLISSLAACGDDADFEGTGQGGAGGPAGGGAAPGDGGAGPGTTAGQGTVTSGTATGSVGPGASGTVGSGDAGVGSGDPTGGGGDGPAPEPGQLTAGDWDDNLNFDLFLDYRSGMLQESPGAHSLAVEERVVLRIVDSAGAPVSGAAIEISDEVGTLFEGPTDGLGEALYFPGIDGEPRGAVTVMLSWPGGAEPLAVAAPAESPWVLTIPDTSERPSAIDVAFVIDTTGSMGDEIAYIKSEVDGIAQRIAASWGQLSMRWALVVYRDVGDAYVTRTFDFDQLDPFRANLEMQDADGGGDTPEALEAALGETRELSWRDGNVARLAFVVADAPSHSGSKEQVLFQHVAALRQLGVKLVPIAGSGTEPLAELQLRSAAQATLGRYVFLTDDSGIGGSHAEPTIPCYFVQYLDDLVVRVVDSELGGVRLLPATDEIVRTVGGPDAQGVCSLEGGGSAQL